MDERVIWPPRPARSGGRARRAESGAALVEFSLVVPVLVLLVFAIIDFGSIYNNYVAVRNGVREGARQGVVAQFGASNTCFGTHTFGVTPSADVQDLMCLTKNRIGIDPTQVYVNVQFDSTYASGNGLIVCSITPVTSLSGLLGPFVNGHFLKSKTEMNIEQLSAVTETAGYENPPPGSNWSWCTPSNPSP